MSRPTSPSMSSRAASPWDRHHARPMRQQPHEALHPPLPFPVPFSALTVIRRSPFLRTHQHPGHALPSSAEPLGWAWGHREPSRRSCTLAPAGVELGPRPPLTTCALSLQSKGSLEVTESQSADAEPPPPPKPDLSRYTGLRTHLTLATTEGKEGEQGPGQPLGGEPRAAPSTPGARAAGTGCRADPKHVGTPHGGAGCARTSGPGTRGSLGAAYGQPCSVGGGQGPS